MFSITLRRATPTVLLLGPFLDASDGATPLEGLSIPASAVLLSKGGGALAAKAEASACSDVGDGMYLAPLGTSDLSDEGHLSVCVSPAGAIPIRQTYMVLSQAAYDQVFASAAAGPPGLLAGARTVAVVVDDGTDPLPGARVRISRGSEVYTDTTGDAGGAVFCLNDGAWTVAISKVGYRFGGASLTLAADASPTYTMEEV